MKVRARADGSALVTLDAAEVEFLRALPDQLREIYGAPPDDPARARIFPRAYLDPTEERSEDEWQAVVHPELLRERLEAIERLLANLGEADPQGRRARLTLTADDVSAWLAVLNDTRLALGTRLEITEDTDPARVAPDDPLVVEKHAYVWLTMLQGELVEAVLRGLPD